MNNTNTIGLNREIINTRSANAVIGVMFFILAMALGAYVRIPVNGSPVPITMQTFFVILSGAVLGRRLGTLCQLWYILLGGMGLPIFHGAMGGMAMLLGPTAGYLIGFVCCAYLIGRLTGPKVRSMGQLIAIFAAGIAVIYGLGMTWLVFLYKVSPTNAAAIGALPFIPGDAAKVLIAAAIYSRISQRSKKIFSA